METIRKCDWDFILKIGKRKTLVTPLSKELKITKSDMSKRLNKLVDLGLLDAQKDGRKKYLKLTKNGLYYLSFINKLLKNRN